MTAKIPTHTSSLSAAELHLILLADRDHLRCAYNAFRAGAGLRAEDVSRLLAARGHHLSANRLRELGRESDRALPISAEQLCALISAWTLEQRRAVGQPPATPAAGLPGRPTPALPPDAAARGRDAAGQLDAQGAEANRRR